MLKTNHYYVTGKVQGVFFRASTFDFAKKLGLTGWVRNLEDGRVEAIVSGEESLVDKMTEWMKHGPKNAVVDNLEIISENYQAFDLFEVIG